MGLFSWLRRKDESAIPEPGSPEFESMVQDSSIPDGQSVAMGEQGWSSTRQTIDLRDTDARPEVEEVLREHGIDPDQEGQTIDASRVPGLRDALLGALGQAGLKIPNAGGFGGGISPPPQDPIAVIEQLSKERDAGELTDAEFEAQKKRLLGE